MKSWILTDDELMDKIYILKAHGMDVERFRMEWDDARRKMTAHRRQDTSTALRTNSSVRFGGGINEV